MFDGDDAGVRASYKAALMSLPFLIPNKSLQFIRLPKDNDPDSFLEKNKLSSLVKILKSPTSLLSYIFEVSSNELSLNDADQKISYDQYLDDLVRTIKDKKIQYFYKSEFKSLFFKKIRNLNKNNIKNTTPKQVGSLQRKQIYSFIASAINHSKVRFKIIECIFQNIELDENKLYVPNKIDVRNDKGLCYYNLLTHYSNSHHPKNYSLLDFFIKDKILTVTQIPQFLKIKDFVCLIQE